jgi:hypothetical protein
VLLRVPLRSVIFQQINKHLQGTDELLLIVPEFLNSILRGVVPRHFSPQSFHSLDQKALIFWLSGLLSSSYIRCKFFFLRLFGRRIADWLLLIL